MTTAADLRQRVTIKAPVDTKNSSGGSVRTYSTVVLANEPVKIVYAPPSRKGNEVVTQQQVRAAVFATMTIRSHPSVNIDDTMIVIFGTRTFEIRAAITTDEYPQWLALQVEELQSKGTNH